VHRLQSVQLRSAHLVVRYDDEIHVAVDVGVPHREGSLQVGAAEVASQNFPDTGDELFGSRLGPRLGRSQPLCLVDV